MGPDTISVLERDGSLRPDRDFLHRMVSGAATIAERGSVDFEQVPTDANLVAGRLERWKDLSARGSEAGFRSLGEIDGQDEVAQEARAHNVCLRSGVGLPAWAESLPDIIEDLCSRPTRPLPSGMADIPFADLFYPLVERRSAMLDDALFAADARADFQRDLAARLGRISGGCLYGWFDAYRKVQAENMPETAHSSGETAIYHGYVDWLRTGHVVRLLQRYPVLARLIAETCAMWDVFVAELSARLSADREEIAGCFFGAAALGKVRSVSASAGDAHERGRCVVILAFGGGERIVYKPRPLGIDRAWIELARKLKDLGAPLEIFGPRVLRRAEYGWCEFIEHRDCRTAEEVRLFYARSGALLALFHALGSTDFHEENVLASASRPVPIDLETLLRPHRETGTDDDDCAHPAIQEVEQRLAASVVSTGYLPDWNSFGDHVWVSGGLAVNPAESAAWPGLAEVNSDSMRPGKETFERKPSQSLPRLNGAPCNPRDSLDLIVGGFRSMAGFILERRDDVAPLVASLFSEARLRVVLRPTRMYSFLLDRALQPERLRDGFDFSVEFEILARWPKEPKLSDRVQFAAETRALAYLDVPLFTMSAGENTLCEISGGTGFSPARMISPMDHARRRLAQLSRNDIEEQCRMIRTALEMNWRRGWTSSPWPDRDVVWSRDEAVRYATKIADRIIDRAVVRGDGACWISASTVGRDEKMHFAPLPCDLYNGAGGVAIFMAALYRVTGRAFYRDWTMKVLAPVLRQIDFAHAGRPFAPGLGIGGGEGVASVIYSLVVVSRLIGEPGLIPRAKVLAHGFDDERIGKDKTFDTMAGAAGAALGLLALAYQVEEDEGADAANAVFEMARHCGEHLLTHPCLSAEADNAKAALLAGISHGAAGLALALVALDRALPDRRFREAAERLTIEENKLFDEKVGNWRDIRFEEENPEEDVRFPCNWCHGAPGIGLARAETRRLGYESPAAQGDVERAAAAILAAPMGMRDAVCCGNFGRISCLLEIGLTEGRADWVEAARRRAAIRMKEAPDRFLWLVGDDAVNHGFFQGLAGIGYEVLRLAEPAQLPCVLAWRSGTDRPLGKVTL